jgi:hypothetical protein
MSGTLPAGVIPPSLRDDVTNLVSRVKLLEMIPNSEVTFNDQTIVDTMDLELINYLVPLVEQCRQEHFVTTRDYVLPPVTSTSNVQNWIEIPDEATGLALRDVYVTDEQGNFTNIPRLSPEQVAARNLNVWWGSSSINSTYGSGGFYLQGNRLYIYPYSLASTRSMRLTFMKRPSKLVKTSEAAQIVSIVGNDVVIGTTTGLWPAQTYVDFIQNRLPHDFVIDKSANQSLYSSPIPLRAVPIVASSGSVLTFDDGITANLSVGDWIAPYGFSPFAQLVPLEATNVLVQATATRLLEALGDREGQKFAEAKLAEMGKALVKLISPRVVGKTQKVSIPSRLSTASSLGWRTF